MSSPASSQARGGYSNVGVDIHDGIDLPIEVDVSTNKSPSDLVLGSGGTVSENAAAGTVVAQITGTDPDAGETLSYALTDDAGGRFVIDGSTGAVRVAAGADLDFEGSSSHAITVRVTDAGGLSYDETFTLNLTDVNEGPSDLTLAGRALSEFSSVVLDGAAGDQAWGDTMIIRALGADGSPAVIADYGGEGFGITGDRSAQIDYTYDGFEATSEMLQVDFSVPQTDINIVLGRSFQQKGSWRNWCLGGARCWRDRRRERQL